VKNVLNFFTPSVGENGENGSVVCLFLTLLVVGLLLECKIATLSFNHAGK
jgi:hypothetical protein